MTCDSAANEKVYGDVSKHDEPMEESHCRALFRTSDVSKPRIASMTSMTSTTIDGALS